MMTTSTYVERRRRLVRRALLSVSTILCSGAALAQSSPPATGDDGSAPARLTGTPADQDYVSESGVDLRTGRYVYQRNDISIGGNSESDSLALVRTTSSNMAYNNKPFGNMTHNWDIFVEERRLDLSKGDVKPGGDYRMTVHYGSRSQTFEAKSNEVGYHQATPGPVVTLIGTGTNSDDNTRFTYTASDGTIVLFRPMGSKDCADTLRCASAEKVTLPDGTEFNLAYAYDAGQSGNRARLSRVTSSHGYALVLEGFGNLVTKACALNLAYVVPASDGLCPQDASSTATYGYDAARISSVSSPSLVENFSYVTTGSGMYSMAFFKGNISSPWLTNGFRMSLDRESVLQDVVDSQTFSDGRSYTCAYQYTPDNTKPFDYQIGGTCGGQTRTGTEITFEFPVKPFTGPSDACNTRPCPTTTKESIVYQVPPGPSTITDPLGQITVVNYCDPDAQTGLTDSAHRCLVTLPQWTIDPAGIKHIFKYDGYHNIVNVQTIPSDGDTSEVTSVSASFDCSNPKICTKPISRTDANGNITMYSYAPEHGGLRRETDPAGADGIQAVKRYSYVQRYAQVYNGNGGYVAADSPIWLLASVKTCQKTATTTESDIDAQTCVGGASDEVVTTYDYGPTTGPNTLLLRGVAVTADGETHRTCYRYDDQGNRVATTTPGAGLTSCP